MTEEQRQETEGTEQVEGEEFGAKIAGDVPPEAAEGVPSPAPELTLEQVQASPHFQRIQGERDRTKNLLTDAETRLAETGQQLGTLRRRQDEELIAQLGDTPEVRDLVTRNREADERAANLSVRETKVAHLEKESLARELGAEYGVDWNRLANADVKTGPEMEAVAKALKGTATVAPAAAPAPSAPALSHAPDAAVSTAAAKSWAQTQQDYIDGKISLQKYQAEAARQGKEP